MQAGMECLHYIAQALVLHMGISAYVMFESKDAQIQRETQCSIWQAMGDDQVSLTSSREEEAVWLSPGDTQQ